MALSKSQLKELKSKMGQAGLKAVRQSASQTKKVVKQKIIKDENFTRTKSVVRYAFKPNELVYISSGLEKNIGLVVSDFEYFSRRVEKNCFFVWVEGAVKQLDGRYMRKI